MKKMICIICPVGCNLTIDEDNKISGNRCNRGIIYAQKELTNPTRVLTTTVKTTNPFYPRLSVKSKEPVPKALIFKIMEALDEVIVTSNTKIGDVIIKNILDTNIDIVATKDLTF